MAQTMKLADVLKAVDEKSGPDSVSIGDVVKALEYRGYGPLLLASALLTVLPTGMIPGVPTLSGILIVFFALQMLVGRNSPWVPQFLAKRKISKQKFASARSKSESYTSKVDRVIKPRLQGLFNPVSVKLIALVCCILAVTMPPLEAVPFMAFIPGIAVAVLGLALSTRDGVLGVLGLIVAAGGLSTAAILLF